ncbi:multidrug ABC transporter permease [Thermococcus guaymasensis DSM 11113]|uniref:Multidrug ABC transporter permease n=1 Tax=Thermococcus guaymasensis DSM 11113 TaxID=1432656 RepID=A0A0X1KLA9_9EURY|nr:ABC transporter permease [Thermococcus guaymasensis]AJC72037.1 multidrug ABC transporter permease [Thermococcus guaymasensis DSM 11113]
MPSLKVLAIAEKELKEYVLKPGSISWGVIFPLVFTFAFAVRFGDVDHLAPGLLTISVLFGTTSFVSSSVIFERRLRTFERLLVAPVSYLEIALAKVLVASAFGIFVGLVSLVFLHFFMVYPIWNIPLLVLFLTISAVLFSAFGLYISLVPENPINAMTWLNLIRLPMMFTSGAIVSLLLFPRWFIAVGLLTPMTYAVEGIRFAMLHYYDVVNPVYSFLVLLLLAMVFIYLSTSKLESLY